MWILKVLVQICDWWLFSNDFYKNSPRKRGRQGIQLCIAFTQSHWQEVAIPDSNDRCKPCRFYAIPICFTVLPDIGFTSEWHHVKTFSSQSSVVCSPNFPNLQFPRWNIKIWCCSDSDLVWGRAVQTPFFQLRLRIRLVTAKKLRLRFIYLLILCILLKQYKNWKYIEIQHDNKQCQVLDKRVDTML